MPGECSKREQRDGRQQPPDRVERQLVRPGGDIFGEPSGPKLLHIPCPQGHVLEVPPEMVDQEVMCPHCKKRFRLQEKNSLEYKRKQQAALERADVMAGKKWFTWAIIFAILVVGGLIAMIVMGNWE